MWLFKLFIWIFMIIHVKCLEVIPERPEIDYINNKYISSANLTIRKRSRRSPYLIDVDLITKVGGGNNITVNYVLLEFLSGRYQPMPIQDTYKLCDFLYKEPYLGKMLAKQLPGNWTCPFPLGEYHFHNLAIHLENFPFQIPFTWASVSVKSRADIEAYFTGSKTKDFIIKYKVYVTISQKPKKQKSKNVI